MKIFDRLNVLTWFLFMFGCKPREGMIVRTECSCAKKPSILSVKYLLLLLILPKKKNGFVSDEEPAWGPETTEAREGRACKQQYGSRTGSATSGAKSDGGFPFPSALHSTHDGGAISHWGRTNRCYWLNPARIDRNGTRY